jgi:hypothetical protein
VNHFLYDWCWSVVLPASSRVFAHLLLLLHQRHYLAANDDIIFNKHRISESLLLAQTQNKQKHHSKYHPWDDASLRSWKYRIHILGCIASFHFIKMPYPREVLALHAGCLTASYIGEFFATAQVVLNNKKEFFYSNRCRQGRRWRRQ